MGWYQLALAENANHEEDNYLIHHDLGNAYYLRFKSNVMVADLSKAICQYQSALRGMQKKGDPTSKADLFMSTAGLAMSLVAQFKVTQQQQDIDRANLCYE